MPTLPETSGLPVWAQILISVLVCIATLAVALKGYFGKGTSIEEKTTATIAAATVMDNISIRSLSDGIAHLSNDVVSLQRELGENTHWLRSKFEQDREICQRLRELREATEELTEIAKRHLK